MKYNATNIDNIESENILENVEKVFKLSKLVLYIWLIGIIVFVAVNIIKSDLSWSFENEQVNQLNEWVSNIISEFIKTTYQTFPLFILLFAVFTFIISYKFFSTKNLNNIIIFAIIIFAAYIINNLYGPFIEDYNQSLTPIWQLLYMAIIIVGIVICVFFITHFIKKKDSQADTTEKEYDQIINSLLDSDDEYPGSKNRNTWLGISISLIISLVISIIFLLRVENYEFITSGIILGVLFSTLMINPEQRLLGILYFIDPEEAENIFKVYKLERARFGAKIKEQKARVIIETEKDTHKINELRKFMDLDRKLRKQILKRRQKKIDELEKKIEDGILSDDEIAHKLDEIENEIPKILDSKDNIKRTNMLLLDEPADNLSIGEKIKNLYGLSEEERDIASKEGLIEKFQIFLWDTDKMRKIRISHKEFSEGLFQDYPQMNISIPQSLVSYLEANEYIVASLASELSKLESNEEEIKLENFKGAGKLKLFKFNTVAEQYMAVLLLGKNNRMLVLGIFKDPEMYYDINESED